MLYRIAYQSQPTVPVTLQLVNGIVTVARERNAAAGITGFLTFRPEWFLQVLEGEQEAVCRLFADIGKDRRHCGLTLLEHRASHVVSSPPGASAHALRRWASRVTRRWPRSG